MISMTQENTEPQPTPVPVVEEKKPVAEKKRSFVSEKDAPPVGAPAENPEKKLLSCEASLMLIYNQSKIQTELLTEMRDLIKNGVSAQPAKPEVKPVAQAPATPAVQKPAPVATPPPAPTPAQVIAEAVKAPSMPMTPALQKLTDAIQASDFASLIYIDETSTDADYYIVRPKAFLGSENFAKIASMMRGLGGEYISQGRNSHFRLKGKSGKA